ncbi:hypothetical protein C0J52_28065 [Blattella germanica]|nr:hypothetical protein C0J52_28065 [Blattella germanica]
MKYPYPEGIHTTAEDMDMRHSSPGRELCKRKYPYPEGIHTSAEDMDKRHSSPGREPCKRCDENTMPKESSCAGNLSLQLTKRRRNDLLDRIMFKC